MPKEIVLHQDEFVNKFCELLTGKREVLSERMALEAVVGQNSPQVWVVAEVDTEHVVHLTLVPVGTFLGEDGETTISKPF